MIPQRVRRNRKEPIDSLAMVTVGLYDRVEVPQLPRGGIREIALLLDYLDLQLGSYASGSVPAWLLE